MHDRGGPFRLSYECNQVPQVLGLKGTWDFLDLQETLDFFISIDFGKKSFKLTCSTLKAAKGLRNRVI